MEDNRLGAVHGRVPIGLLGSLALLVATETCVIERGRGLGATQAWLWNACGRIANRSSTRDCKVLCLGDSQVKHGLIVKVLEDRLKQRTMNLAVSGGQAPTSYFQLRRVLDRGAKPSAVIVDFYQLLLSCGPEANSHLWAEYLSVAECLDLARTARDPQLFGWVMTGRVLPSVRFRQGLRELVKDRVKGVGPCPTDRLPVFRRNDWKNRGSLVFEKNPKPFITPDMDGWIRTGFLPDRMGKEVNLIYVSRLLKLAYEHKIPVFWVIPPEHPKIEARKQLEGINDRYTRFVHRALAQFPNLTVLDTRYSAYPADVFCDQSHLDRDGATTMTSDVAAVIRRQQAGERVARYVPLPAYRRVEPKVPMEDLLETFFALNKADAESTKR